MMIIGREGIIENTALLIMTFFIVDFGISKFLASLKPSLKNRNAWMTAMTTGMRTIKKSVVELAIDK